MRKLSLAVLLATMFIVFGCRDYYMKTERITIAECYGKKLYAEDLEGVVPAGMSKIDSLDRVNAFVDSWIRRQLLIHQAENNLPANEQNFTKQLEDYRNSLIIYAYESQLIGKYLDTIVSDEEIAAYYEDHKQNFQLRYTMVKVAYVAVDSDNKYLKDFKKLMSNRDTLMLPQLNVLAEHTAATSYFDVDTWVRLDELLERVPLEIYNTESFLKKNRFVSFEKDNLTYMIRFEDYLMEESISPLEIEQANIKNILLLKRQKELLSKMNEDLYKKAEEENVFEIY
ncbi:MAG: hypothetical protein IJL44_02990 [Bacteroidales bacterium]|nr:hypothetical protein [Bacteroidales bacterium]